MGRAVNPNAPPPRFCLFERGVSFHGLGVFEYARRLGCDAVALLLPLVTAQKMAAARASGLRIFFYDMPGGWRPDTWARSAAQVDRLLGLYPWTEGPVVDQEGGWDGPDGDREHPQLEAWMNRRSASAVVWWTSYPDHARRRSVAARCTRVRGIPQAYGIRTPGTGAQLVARVDSWRPLFRAGVVPAVAGWDRTAEEQARYLEAFRPPAFLWVTSGPAPGSPTFEAIRRWADGGASGILAACVAALVGAKLGGL